MKLYSQSQREKGLLATLAAFLVVGSMMTLGGGFDTDFLQANVQTAVDSIKKDIVVDFSNFDETLLAKQVIVIDEKTGTIVYEKGEGQAAALASLVKLVAVVTALDYLELDDEIVFTSQAIGQTGDSFVVEGDRVSVADAVSMILVASSNDAAYALAEYIERVSGIDFQESMKNKMTELGFESFRFNNPTGLDQDGQNGAYATPEDIARFSLYALETYPQLFSQTKQPSISITTGSGVYEFVNTNLQTRYFPGLLLSKTGFTDIAGGNLVSVVQIGLDTRMVVVVLGSTFEGRFSDSRAIVNYLVRNIQ